MSAKVSVIIPTFNYGQFIGEAVKSVLLQTYPISEIIVVDDGSTDNTKDVVSSLGGKVRYINQKNSGVSAARNNGIKNSGGDFVAFLDADDTWFPEKIEKQIAVFLEDRAVGLAHCAVREFDSQTNETIRLVLDGSEGWVADELLISEKSVILGAGGAIMVSRAALEEVGGFDTNLKIGEDWDFCYRVARKYKVGFVPEVLVNYRNHGKNAHLNVKEMERSNCLAWSKAFKTNDVKILRLRRKAFGKLHKALAGSYLQSGQYLDFSKHLLKSLWFNPIYLKYYLAVSFRGREKTNSD